MLETLAKIFDLLKIPTHYVAAAFCILLGLWFWKQRDFYTEIALLLSAIILLGRCFNWMSEKVKDFWFNRTIKKILQSLTVPEKEVLRQYIESQAHTIFFNGMDSTIIGLQSRRILICLSKTGYGYSDEQEYQEMSNLRHKWLVDNAARYGYILTQGAI